MYTIVVIGDVDSGKYFIRVVDKEGNNVTKELGVGLSIYDISTGDVPYTYIKRSLEYNENSVNVVFVNDSSFIK